MATTSKLSFRARNLDATKSMPVYCADELPDLAECTPINRAVAQLPTGMEKDEENESHLQEAILAQQASTSGIAVENHVIPTPKVFTVDAEHYDAVYPVQPAPSINQLIKVQASLSLGNEEPEYDIDSEDEAWLAERGGHIAGSDFEKMMELLEGASGGLQICQPGEARTLLKDFDMDLVDDVYDYWLQKRKDAAALSKIASLIARVKTDARRDASSSDIAYVAFRRRLERMQTRKNRKNDEDSYEKILKLGHDLSRAVVLYDMLRRREYSKRSVIAMDQEICKCRWTACDFGSALYNQLLAKSKSERNTAMSPTEESLVSPDETPGGVSPPKVKGHKRRPHFCNSVSEAEKELIVNRPWLKKNAEQWNRPASAAVVLSAGASPTNASVADTERNAEAAVDGRYTFKRRRGCIYRSSLFSNPPEEPKVNPAERFYRTFMPSANGVRCIGYARRRMGRGGRIIFDRVLVSPPSTSQSALDPLFCPVIDSTKTYQCKLVDARVSGDHSDSSDSEEQIDRKDDELEYRRREERYAKRIFGMSDTSTTQRFQAGIDLGDTSSRGSGEQIVVLGEDSNGSRSGNEQNVISINGVHEADSLRVVNLQQNGPSLDVRGRSVSDCVSQPVLLTASVPGKVEEMGSLPNSSFVNYPQKRVHDCSLRLSSSQLPSAETSEASPVFYAHLPPLPSHSVGMVVTGEKPVHQPTPTFDYVSLKTSTACQPVVVTAALPGSLDRLDRNHISVSSQKIVKEGQDAPRVGGRRRRSFASSNVTQLASLILRPEANLQRFNTCGLNGDVVAHATPCVDTKRLELAIKGSGARIKPAPLVAQSILPPYPPETKTLRDLLLGTTALSNKVVINKTAATPVVSRTYTTPQFVPVVGDMHRHSSYPTSVVTVASCYVPLTDALSAGNDKLSPPTSSHSLSTVVQNSLAQSYCGVADPKIQKPVAAISSRSSLNGTQVDTRRCSKVNKIINGTGGDTLPSTPLPGIEVQPLSAQCVDASTSVTTDATGKTRTGGDIIKTNGNCTASAAVVAENLYPQSVKKDSLSNKLTSGHHDIAMCRGMVNYVIN